MRRRCNVKFIIGRANQKTRARIFHRVHFAVIAASVANHPAVVKRVQIPRPRQRINFHNAAIINVFVIKIFALALCVSLAAKIPARHDFKNIF